MDTTPRSDAEHSTAAIRADIKRRYEPDAHDAGQNERAREILASEEIERARAAGREAEGCTHGPDHVCRECYVDEVTVNQNGDKVYHRHGHHAAKQTTSAALSREALSVKPTLRIDNEPPMTLESVRVEVIPLAEPKQETWRDREPLL